MFMIHPYSDITYFNLTDHFVTKPKLKIDFEYKSKVVPMLI
jgi:hypothetical protein